MKLNPVFKKELSINSRSINISWLILVFNTVLSIVAGSLILHTYSSYKYSGNMDYSIMLKMYIFMAYFEFIMLVLYVPALTSQAISSEREKQTLDILLSTKIRPIQIILGKLEASIHTVLILAISSMPIFSLSFIFGGIKLVDIIMLIIIFGVEALVLGSIGIFFSTVFKKTAISTAVTYFTLLITIMGSYFLVNGMYYLKTKNSLQLQDIQPDIGRGVYLLLLNPAITFSGLISNQAGNKRGILNICSSFGNYYNDFVVEHWIIISLIIQIIIAIVLLICASRNINPLKTTKLFKKRLRNL